MYQLLKEPIKYRLYEGDEFSTPLATLVDDYGSIVHIDEDDHCFVLVHMQEDGFGKWANHWFQEAVDVLKTLSLYSQKEQGS